MVAVVFTAEYAAIGSVGYTPRPLRIAHDRVHLGQLIKLSVEPLPGTAIPHTE